MAQRTRHYNRNMGLKAWKKWTDWPLMVLSVVFLVVYSWEILSRTHIALCETVINAICGVRRRLRGLAVAGRRPLAVV